MLHTGEASLLLLPFGVRGAHVLLIGTKERWGREDCCTLKNIHSKYTSFHHRNRCISDARRAVQKSADVRSAGSDFGLSSYPALGNTGRYPHTSALFNRAVPPEWENFQDTGGNRLPKSISSGTHNAKFIS